MKIPYLSFYVLTLAFALLGGARAESVQEVTIHDILTDEGSNFGPFKSVSVDSMGEWLYVYRFFESEELKSYSRYLAVGLRLHGTVWSGTMFFRVISGGAVSREYRLNLSTSETTQFIALIDSSEVFNLTAHNRTRIPRPGEKALMGEELSKDGSRSFMRGVHTSVPAQQIVHFMDTLPSHESKK